MTAYRERLMTWLTPGAGEASISPEWLKLAWSAKPADRVVATLDRLSEEGVITAALNWYRASRGHRRAFEDFSMSPVSVPTLLIRGRTETGRRAVDDAASLMVGEYRVAEVDGRHFIVDEQPRLVAEETLAHLRAHPVS
jgi:hypothetical protein